jgi:hypothetical protein
MSPAGATARPDDTVNGHDGDTGHPPWFRRRQVTVCPDPVFVIGSPRSGTTALGKSLGEHPALWVSNETKFLAVLFGGGQVADAIRDERDRPTASWLRTNDVGDDEFEAAVGLGVNALISSRCGGRRWIDHTPHYTDMAPLLSRMFPGAHFIHIVRDGRHVVESMLHFADRFRARGREDVIATLPAYTRDFGSACRTWVDMVDHADAFAATHPGRCTTVRNEDLAAAPDEVFARVLEAVGEPDHPAPAQAWSARRFNSSFQTVDGRALERGTAGSGWTADQHREFGRVAGPTMARHGYTDGAAPAIKVEGEGLSAKVSVGRRRVRVDGERLVVE